MAKRRSCRKFPSIAAAASALGVSESLIKQAKRMGCAAFPARGSVEERPLVQFIAEHRKELESGGVALRDQKLSEEIRKLRIKNDKDEKLVVPRAVIASAFAEWAAAVRKTNIRRLVEEWPSMVAGLEIPQIRIKGRQVCDEHMAHLQRLADLLEAVFAK